MAVLAGRRVPFGSRQKKAGDADADMAAGGGPGESAISGRLLPAMLDERRLATVSTLNILDFGRANSASLEFFNQFSCRLCVLDAAESLLEWSGDIAARADDPPRSHRCSSSCPTCSGPSVTIATTWCFSGIR
jgi:hypothetical protein